MAALCDIFVHDAFGTAHRAEASTYGIAQFAKIACAGPLLAAEIDAIGKALSAPKRPLIAIVAGSKVSTKLTILQSLADKVDGLIVGGGIANTFMLAAGLPIGKSLAEADLVDQARAVMQAMKARGADVPIPQDVVVAKEFKADARATVKPATDVAADDTDPRHRPEDRGVAGRQTQVGRHDRLERAGGRVRVRRFRERHRDDRARDRGEPGVQHRRRRRHAGGDRQVRHRERHRLHLHRRRRVPRNARGQDAAGLRDPAAPRQWLVGGAVIMAARPHAQEQQHASSMTRATKIVATLGPASSDPGVLEQLLRAGVDVVRLNFSHGAAQDHIDRAQLVRDTAVRVGKPVALMADLQGPKIRVGKFADGKVMLKSGEPFVLDATRSEPGDQQAVGLDYKELPRDVKPGDTLLLNDGLIVLTVDHVQAERVHTRVKVGGVLSNNKGINKQGGGLTAPALTAKDMEDIKTAMAFQADYLAVSFPKSATDMEMARQLANVAGEAHRHKPAMIAKIERSEAIPQLENILRASDGIMVARGDLAIEVGNAAVPALQKRMIRMAREMDKTVITATQMMESMIVNPVPTRAEVSDVANAVLDGTDAVMLSAETAAGKYPVETVEHMALIALEAERAEDVQARGRLHQQALRPHRPEHRDGRALHCASPGLQGDHRAHRERLHRAVDEPAPDPRADLRPHVEGHLRAPHGAVPQRAADPDAFVHRSRPRARRGRAPAGAARGAQAGRHLRHHLRRADGLPGRHQHAQGVPGWLRVRSRSLGTPLALRERAYRPRAVRP